MRQILMVFFLIFSSIIVTNKVLSQSDLPFFLRNTSNQDLIQVEEIDVSEKLGQLVVVTWRASFTPQEQEQLFHNLRENKVGTVLIDETDLILLEKKVKSLRSLNTNYPLLIGLQTPFYLLNAEDVFLLPSPRSIVANENNEKVLQLYNYRLQLLGEIGVDFFMLDGALDEQMNSSLNGNHLFGSDPLRAGQIISDIIRMSEKHGMMAMLKGFSGEGFAEILKDYQFPVNKRNLTELKIMDWIPFQMARLRGLSMIQTSPIALPAITEDYTACGLAKKFVKDQLILDLGFKGLIMSPSLRSNWLKNDFGNALNLLQAFEAGNDLLVDPVDIDQDVQFLAEKILGDIALLDQLNSSFSKVIQAKAHAAKRKSQKEARLNDFNLQAYYTFNHYENSSTILHGIDCIPMSSSVPVALVNCGASLGVFEERFSAYCRNTNYHVKHWKDLKRTIERIPVIQPIVVNVYPGFYRESEQDLSHLREVLIDRHVILNFFEDIAYLAALENIPFKAILVNYDHNLFTEDLAAQQLMGGAKIQGVFPSDIGIKWKQGTKNISAEPTRLKFTFPEELGISREKLFEIDVIANKGIAQKAYPGCQVMAAKDGKVFYHQSFGYQTYDNQKPVDAATSYDLASITKTAASTNAIMKLVEQGKLDLNATLGVYLSDLVGNTPYASLKLKEILAHQAGLSPWIPFYTKTLIDKQPDPAIYSSTPTETKRSKVANELYILDSYRDTMLAKIIATPLKPKGNYKYSDLGYYFLQKIIEQITNQTLDEYLKKEFYVPMGLPTLGFNPLDYYPLENIAPTERDNYFRHQLVQGYVHDMGAAMTGGVAGHAGLFSNATDLMALMQMLLNDGYYGGQQFLKPTTIKSFTSCQFCPRNRRGAGFDKPVLSLDGGPTSKLVSLESFGHTGFTGTQAWADPVNGVNYVFLSNRVYPSAENRKLITMGIRTEIQRVIYEAVNEAKQPIK
jgi:beta-N-acetylhexosaminidase